jgi:cell division transport system permease protein
VGATQWFIKKPFLGQSFWQGILGALLAVGLLTGLLQVVKRYMPDVLAFTDVPSLAMLYGAVLVLGLVIALLSTWFAVGRYLRMNSEDLHWS